MAGLLSVPDILVKLDNIDKEAQENKASFSVDNLQLFRESLLAIRHCVEHIDSIKYRSCLYFCNVTVNNKIVYVPIHLENYRASPEDKKKQLLDALPRLFIESYEVVKNSKNSDLDIFASKMSGNCIDARTRSAFDYAAAILEPPCFQDIMQKCSVKVQAAYAEPTYYQFFIELYKNYWNLPYSKDRAESSPCQTNGVLNEESFDLVSDYMVSYLCYDYETEGDYLSCLKSRLVKGNDVIFFLLFALYSAIKNEDKVRSVEILNNICKSKISSDIYISIQNNLMLYAKKVDGMFALSDEKTDCYKQVISHSLTFVNSVLNRLYPFYWTKHEKVFLAKTLSNIDVINLIVKKDTKDAKSIILSKYLKSLVEQVYKELEFNLFIDLTLSLNKIEYPQNKWDIFNYLVDTSNPLKKEELFRICEFDINRSEKGHYNLAKYLICNINKYVDTDLCNIFVKLPDKKRFLSELRSAHREQSTLTFDQVRQLIRVMQLFAQNSISDEVLFKEISRIINTIFSKRLDQEYQSSFKRFNTIINEKIASLRLKERNFEDRSQWKAKECIATLADKLEKNRDDFFKNKIIDIHEFRSRCDADIQVAKPVLSKHRGWKKILGNLTLCIFSGGVGFLCLMAINKFVNNRFLFFSETKSSKQLDECGRTLDDMSVSGGLAL